MSRSYESPTRKAQAEATKLAIMRALVDLLVEEHPATISVPRVAERAEVSVRIVYHYFPTKDALFDGLVEALPGMLQPIADVGPIDSPRRFADAVPSIFEYHERNAEVFRAMRLSEWGERLHERRRGERHGRIDLALSPLADQVNDDELAMLRALVGLVTSFDGFDALTTTWGLDREQAAAAAAWATRVLCDRARRSGVR